LSKPPLLLVGLSVRALAQSARRAGIACVGIDLFGDQDAVAASVAHYRVPGMSLNGQWTFKPEALQRQVVEAVRRHGCVEWVAGSGFEVQSHLLNSLHPGLRLLGNGPAMVARMKDPETIKRLFKKVGLCHPKIRFTPPRNAAGWLFKPAGGSGGYGIGPAATHGLRVGTWQRQVAGHPGSVLFVANGKKLRLIGINQQWLAPSPAHPFRYGGALGQQSLPQAALHALKQSLQKLVRREALVGLNGLDFIWDGQTITALEINPRPPASFELYDPDFKKGLMRAHIDACRGRLPHRKEGVGNTVRTYAVVHIAKSTRFSAEYPLTGACRDRPGRSQLLKAGQPLCTLHTEGPTTTAAIRLLQMELNRLEQLFKGGAWSC
jgi:predicted ATP-grasp superfamily ATP-dependent carboligase